MAESILTRAATLRKSFLSSAVRFIAVNDNYDSLNFSTSDSLIVPIKNFLNDSYCRDISIKVRSNFESRRRNGEFVSNYTPYGYLRSPNDKTQLVIDEAAGEIVRDIFRWKVEGMSPVTIAEKLNLRGVLSPSEHKRSIGINYKTAFQTNARSKWSPKTVIRILTNEVYTGVLIQGKRTTPNYKVKHTIVKDEQDWSRIENAHEPIIQVREFELVQKLMQEDSRRHLAQIPSIPCPAGSIVEPAAPWQSDTLLPTMGQNMPITPARIPQRKAAVKSAGSPKKSWRIPSLPFCNPRSSWF